MKELKSDEPYEVAPGCTTITFDLRDESLMLPYSAFVSGNFKGDSINLLFQEWRIEIDGSELREVWRLLQMQDLFILRTSSIGEIRCDSRECQIRKITAKNLIVK